MENQACMLHSKQIYTHTLNPFIHNRKVSSQNERTIMEIFGIIKKYFLRPISVFSQNKKTLNCAMKNVKFMKISKICKSLFD